MQKTNESPTIPFASAPGVDSPQNSTVSTELGSWRMLSMSAYSPNEPFSVAEKVDLLVNILQTLVPDLPLCLFNCVVSDGSREPKWSDMALPKGRSVNSCKIAFEEMRRSFALQSGSTRPYSPYVAIAPNPASTRSMSAHDLHLATQRPMQPIKPRPMVQTTESPNPPVTNGESPTYLRGTLLEPTSGQPTTRKRGRPSKEVVAERTAKLAAQGKVYEPKKRPAKRPRPSLGPEALDMKSEEASRPLIQTPMTRASEPVERSSSGKRRARRQDREDSPSARVSAGAETGLTEPEPEQEQESILSAAESPSDRLFPSHRDRGSVGSSLSRRTQQESDTLEQGQVESDFPT